jgi:hypothetical protein
MYIDWKYTVFMTAPTHVLDYMYAYTCIYFYSKDNSRGCIAIILCVHPHWASGHRCHNYGNQEYGTPSLPSDVLLMWIHHFVMWLKRTSLPRYEIVWKRMSPTAFEPWLFATYTNVSEYFSHYAMDSHEVMGFTFKLLNLKVS